MTTNAATEQHNSRFRPKAGDAYVVLILAAGWIPVAVSGIHAAFAMAWATGLTICAVAAGQAMAEQPLRWTQFVAWVVRLGAVVAGWWLFTTAERQPARIAAFVAYAALYVVCDWVATHRSLQSRRGAQ